MLIVQFLSQCYYQLSIKVTYCKISCVYILCNVEHSHKPSFSFWIGLMSLYVQLVLSYDVMNAYAAFILNWS